MSRNFSAYDVTGFLDVSIGSYLNAIEDLVIKMMKSDSYDERVQLKFDIQNIIWQCNSVLR